MSRKATGIVHTKVARQEKVREWIAAGLVHSQAQVVELLRNAGYVVT